MCLKTLSAYENEVSDNRRFWNSNFSRKPVLAVLLSYKHVYWCEVKSLQAISDFGNMGTVGGDDLSQPVGLTLEWMQAFEQRLTDHLDKAVRSTASVSKLTVRVEKSENESNQTNAMLHMMRREHQSLVEYGSP